MAPTTRATDRAAITSRHARHGRQTSIVAGFSPVLDTFKNRITKTSKTTRSEQPEPKPKPETECLLCATTKLSKSFPNTKISVCKHLVEVCNHCIGRMVKEMISTRRLAGGVLACPFPDCDYEVIFADVKWLLRKSLYEDWDQALTTELFSKSEDFIACLNTKCGHHFSIEDWKEDCPKTRKRKISCPYCKHDMCINCVRPWHKGQSCETAHQEEEVEANTEALNRIGAKPCPKCGMQIQKEGGCDHMHCDRCGVHFCWQCLVFYTPTMEHASGCRHGRRDIAAEPGNYFNGPMQALGLQEGHEPLRPPQLPGGPARMAVERRGFGWLRHPGEPGQNPQQPIFVRVDLDARRFVPQQPVADAGAQPNNVRNWRWEFALEQVEHTANALRDAVRGALRQ